MATITDHDQIILSRFLHEIEDPERRERAKLAVAALETFEAKREFLFLAISHPDYSIFWDEDEVSASLDNNLLTITVT